MQATILAAVRVCGIKILKRSMQKRMEHSRQDGLRKRAAPGSSGTGIECALPVRVSKSQVDFWKVDTSQRSGVIICRIHGNATIGEW